MSMLILSPWSRSGYLFAAVTMTYRENFAKLNLQDKIETGVVFRENTAWAGGKNKSCGFHILLTMPLCSWVWFHWQVVPCSFLTTRANVQIYNTKRVKWHMDLATNTSCGYLYFVLCGIFVILTLLYLCSTSLESWLQCNKADDLCAVGAFRVISRVIYHMQI